MKSFTMGTNEMIAEMINSLPEKYEMSLSITDMAVLIKTLGAYSGYITLTEEDGDLATDLFSSIATTLGIEGV